MNGAAASFKFLYPMPINDMAATNDWYLAFHEHMFEMDLFYRRRHNIIDKKGKYMDAFINNMD